jgi:hypothetical protein
MKKDTKTNTNGDNPVQLLSEEDVEQEFGLSIATASAAAADSATTWAKFVLTDDQPNGNRQRIPIEEFGNVIKTGAYKPLKMAIAEIADGHEESKPLGVITNLIQDANRIIALAALWGHERSGDVGMIKKYVNSGKPVNISWELLYGSSVKEEGGIEALRDITLTAATIVGIPAYAGRTQFIAVAASKKWSGQYIKSLPDSSFLHVDSLGERYFAYRDDSGKIDTTRFPTIMEEITASSLPQNTLKIVRHQIKKMDSVIQADASLLDLIGDVSEEIMEEQTLDIKELEGKVAELEAKLAEAVAALGQKEAALTETASKLEAATASVAALEEELNPLREFKATAELNAQREARVAAIKAKFETASINKSDEYFTENMDKFLSMEEASLDFMIQELVAFKEEDAGKGSASLTKKGSDVPNIPGNAGTDLSDIKVLGAALRESKRK